MKRDRREWFANPRDGTGMDYVFTGSCAGTGREWNQWNGNGTGRDWFSFVISIPVSLSSMRVQLQPPRLRRFA